MIKTVMQPKDRKDSVGLSRQNTQCLRGALAICVVLSHVLATPEIYRIIPSSIVDAMGYFPVSCFFFLSGYGLMTQYRKRGERYIAEYPRHRLLPFYLIICGLTVLYSVLTLVTNNEPITLPLMLKTLTFGSDTIISKGWYLQVALICYVAFYLVIRFVGNVRYRILIAVSILLAYIALCVALDFSVSYYQTAPNFLLGCLWYRISAISFRVPRWTTLTANFALLGVVLGASIYAPAGNTALRAIACILFVLLVLQIMNYITLIKIPFLSFLGKISFEIYVIHGFFMILYRKGLTIGNEALYALTVIVSSLIFAALLHPAVAKIYDLCRIERK